MLRMYPLGFGGGVIGLKKCSVIDLGSNTVRLSVYRCEGLEFSQLFSRKEMVGLAGYVEEGRLSDKGIKKACEVLLSFRELLQNLEITDVHVFATASLRNIDNTAEALETIRLQTGYMIEVISGEEEARLDFIGASCSVKIPSGILIDIGGGSTEIVKFENHLIQDAISLPIGSLGLFRRYVKDLFPGKNELLAMRTSALEVLRQMETPGASVGILCGVGGTVRAAAKLQKEMCGTSLPGQFPTADLKKMLRQLRTGDRSALMQLLRVVPDRIHTAIPGMILLDVIADYFDVHTIVVSSCGVREGYLLEHVLRR